MVQGEWGYDEESIILTTALPESKDVTAWNLKGVASVIGIKTPDKTSKVLLNIHTTTEVKNDLYKRKKNKTRFLTRSNEKKPHDTEQKSSLLQVQKDTKRLSVVNSIYSMVNGHRSLNV